MSAAGRVKLREVGELAQGHRAAGPLADMYTTLCGGSRHQAKPFTHANQDPHHSLRKYRQCYPISQMKKLRPREGGDLSRGIKAGKGKAMKSNHRAWASTSL